MPCPCPPPSCHPCPPQLVADTFVKSFKEVADLATKVRFPALKEAAEVLEDGGMAARFWDVDMLQVRPGAG